MFKRFLVLLGMICSSSGSRIQSNENTRIVGGKPVDIKQANFIVLLMYNDRPLCGASIISSSYSLTASHCTEDLKPTDLTILSGSSKVGEGETHYVSQIISHPKYDNTNFDYDFCLLKVYGKIFFNENQRAVKLPEVGDVSKEGELVRALGWGKTLNPDESSDYLRQVELIIIDPKECEEAYEIYNIKIEHNKVCAVHPERKDGKDACQGDSGGPLQSLEDGRLLGIVSFGLGCAKAKYAGIYARVSSVRGWIKEVTHV